jgi:hypothetical protein
VSLFPYLFLMPKLPVLTIGMDLQYPQRPDSLSLSSFAKNFSSAAELSNVLNAFFKPPIPDKRGQADLSTNVDNDSYNDGGEDDDDDSGNENIDNLQSDNLISQHVTDISQEDVDDENGGRDEDIVVLRVEVLLA